MKKITTLRLPVFVIVFVNLLIACGPEKPTPTSDTDTTAPAHSDRIAYLLNEGIWSGNNAEISRINLTQKSIDPQWFSRINGRGLGDVAQDLVHYGSRLYCAVWNSSTVEVINPATGQSIKQISFGNRGPRYIVCHDGKVYVSCYDRSIVRIDTNTLEIESSCHLSGMQPEQLCRCGNRLIVCNSWQYASDGTTILYDSTVSVVDIASFSEVDRITVGTNPIRIQAIDDNRCVISCSGNYGSESASAKLLSLDTKQLSPLAQAATAMDFHDGFLYHYTTTYDAQWNPVASFYRTDMQSLESTPILTSASIPYAYSISVDPLNGNILVSNSPYTSSGDLHCYAPDGSLLWVLEAGNMCQKVVF